MKGQRCFVLEACGENEMIIETLLQIRVLNLDDYWTIS